MQSGADLAARRGVTLVDSVLYIAIVMALVVAGISLYGKTAATADTFDQVGVMAALATETRAIFAAVPAEATLPPLTATALDFLNAPALQNPTLIASGAVPSKIVDPATPDRLNNAWGGRTLVLAGTNAAGEPAMYLYLDRVPSQACMRLSSTDAQGNGVFSQGVRRVRFVSTVDGTTTDTVRDAPLSIETLTESDHCGGGSANMTLVYELALK